MAIDLHVDTSNVTRRQLRDFGLLVGMGLVVIFGLLRPLVAHEPFPTWPWMVWLVLLVLGLTAPQSLKPLYTAWMKLGAVLGYVNTRIILGLMYYAVIVPIGFMMQRTGQDPMHRAWEPEASTYRIPVTLRPPEHLEKPY